MRSGTIFASNVPAYQRWRSRVLSGATVGRAGAGLTGADLERVIMAMSVSNPDIVAVRVRPN